MGPVHRIVVICPRCAEVLYVLPHELDGLQPECPIEDDQLVEAAIGGALGRGAVVADDVVDEGVVEDLEVGQGIDQPPDVVVGVLEEPGEHLHLAGEHRLQVVWHVVPRRDLGGAGR